MRLSKDSDFSRVLLRDPKRKRTPFQLLGYCDSPEDESGFANGAKDSAWH